MNTQRFLAMLACVTLGTATFSHSNAAAQQTLIKTPYHAINDSFYENFGIGWGVRNMNRNGGWFFQTGPASAALPPFGGYDPAADARFGVGGHFGNNNFFFNLAAGQGSSRSMVMETPMVMVPNGGTGSFFSGSQRPFVTGIIPVVGSDAPYLPGSLGVPNSVSPLQQRLEMLKQQQASGAAPAPARIEPRVVEERPPRAAQQPAPRAVPAGGDDAPLVLGDEPVKAAGNFAASGGRAAADSTANRGDISVNEIRQQQALVDSAREQELQDRLAKARSYEEAGKTGIARIYYQQAAARASGELKQRLQEKIASLK